MNRVKFTMEIDPGEEGGPHFSIGVTIESAEAFDIANYAVQKLTTGRLITYVPPSEGGPRWEP